MTYIDSLKSAPYCIRIKRPSECSVHEINLFVKLVICGGEVTYAGLKDRVENAEMLSFLCFDGELVGVAGIKNPGLNYRSDIEGRSRVCLAVNEFPFELGWVYVRPDHEGGKSGILCRPLVESVSNKGIFATSRVDNLKMQCTLKKLGFKRCGDEWNSVSNTRYLRLFVRHAFHESSNEKS